MLSHPQRGLLLGVSRSVSPWFEAGVRLQLAPAQEVSLPSGSSAVLGTTDAALCLGFRAANGRLLAPNARIKPVLAMGLGGNLTGRQAGLYVPATVGFRIKVMEYINVSLIHTYKISLTSKFIQHQVLSFGFDGTIPVGGGKKTQPAVPARLSDTDLDGVADIYDDCPASYGLKDNHGCPAVVAPSQGEIPQKSPGAGRDGLFLEPPVDDAGAIGMLFPPPGGEGQVVPDAVAMQRMQDEEALRVLARQITFPEGGSTLASEQALKLYQVIEILDRNPNCQLRIVGHTDDMGTPQQNLIVSVKRAYSVKIFLMHDLQIPAERLEHEGFAALLPIGSNDTPEGRALNRRIEFLLVGCEN